MTLDSQPLIQIEDLTKIFYTDEIETHALSGIHLSIQRGEYLAMSGPSGCGKSTLLSIIGLLDTPTSGKYVLNGNSVENLNFGERSRIRNLVTHDPRFARHAERNIHLFDGKVVAEGDVQEESSYVAMMVAKGWWWKDGVARMPRPDITNRAAS